MMQAFLERIVTVCPCRGGPFPATVCRMSDWMSALMYAFCTLRRQPIFMAVALLTLAHGIGAITEIFSVIKTVVLNSLPYGHPDRIAVVWEVSPEGNQDRVSTTFEDWKRGVPAFESLAAYRHVDFSHSASGDPRNVPRGRATPELFAVLKANARLGQTLLPTESVVGADRVVVVRHGFWERVLDANPNIIGTTVTLDALPVTVVGVTPPGFEFRTARRAAARGSGDRWRAVRFDHTAYARDCVADGAGLHRRQHGRARSSEQPASHRDRRPHWSGAGGAPRVLDGSLAALVLIAAGPAAAVLPALPCDASGSNPCAARTVKFRRSAPSLMENMWHA